MVLEDLVEVLFQGVFCDTWESRFFLVVCLVADDQVEVYGGWWVFVSAVIQGLGGWRLIGVPDRRWERCCRGGCCVGGVVVFLVFLVVLGGCFCFFGVVVCLGGCDSVGVLAPVWWCRRVGGVAVDVSLGVCCGAVLVRGVVVVVVRGGWLVVFWGGCLFGHGVVVVGVGFVVVFLVVGVVVGGVCVRSVVLVGVVFFFCVVGGFFFWVFFGGFFGLVDVVVFLALKGIRGDGIDVVFTTEGGSKCGVSWSGLLVRVRFLGRGPSFLVCPRLGAGGDGSEHGGCRLLPGGVGGFSWFAYTRIHFPFADVTSPQDVSGHFYNIWGMSRLYELRVIVTQCQRH